MSQLVSPLSRVLSLLLVIVLSAVLLFAYRDSDQNGFHFDDYPNIVQHTPVQLEQLTLSGLWQAGRDAFLPSRPLPSISFAFDWWRGQGSPEVFQATNRMLHVAAALVVGLLLFEVLGKMLPRRELLWLAPLAAAWWALHPIQVQGVTYIVQRMALLAALFTLLSVWSYVRARQSGGARGLGWWLLTWSSLVAAVASKENALIAPFLWILAEYGVVRHGLRLLRGRLDAVVIALPFVLLAWVVLDLLLGGPFSGWATPGYAGRDFTLEERLLTQPRVLAFHLGQVFWPLPGRFSLEHDIALSRGVLDPPATAVALAGLVLWIAAGLWCLFSQALRGAGFLILWVPATLVIESSVIPLEMVFEHRMYLATVGLAGLVALACGWLAGTGTRARLGVLVAGMGLVLVLAAFTQQRLPVWRTAVTLGEHSARVASTSARTWLNLGIAYQEDDQLDKAESALSRSIALDPDSATAYANRGTLYSEDPARAQAARADFNHALRLDPGNITALVGRGTLQKRLGHIGLASADYQKAIRAYRQRPAAARSRDAFDIAVAYYQLGLVYRQSGRLDEAVAAYKNAIGLRPGLASAWFNLGIIQLERKQYPDAGKSFSAALAYGGEDADAYYYRGLAGWHAGDPGSGHQDLSRALQLNPRDGEFWLQRGLLGLERGDVNGARHDLRQACELGREPACASLSPEPDPGNTRPVDR